MDEKEILEKQVNALEKLLQIKEAIIKEQENRIEILESRTQDPQPYSPFVHPFIPQPSIGCQNLGQQHEYPAVWHGIQPPSCIKCGFSLNGPTFTLTDGTGFSPA